MGVPDGNRLGEFWNKCKSYFALKAHGHAAATVSTAGFCKPDGTSLSVSYDGTLSVQNVDVSAFLSSYPLGSYYETEIPQNPGEIYGGSWESAPSMGGWLWRRIAPVVAIDVDLFLQAHPMKSYMMSDQNPALIAGVWEENSKTLGAPIWRRMA